MESPHKWPAARKVFIMQFQYFRSTYVVIAISFNYTTGLVTPSFVWITFLFCLFVCLFLFVCFFFKYNCFESLIKIHVQMFSHTWIYWSSLKIQTEEPNLTEPMILQFPRWSIRFLPTVSFPLLHISKYHNIYSYIYSIQFILDGYLCNFAALTRANMKYIQRISELHWQKCSERRNQWNGALVTPTSGR